MNKFVPIRNLSPDQHRALVARAKAAGISVSDYLRQEVPELANRPTMAELYAKLKRRKSVHLEVSAAELIRQERDNR